MEGRPESCGFAGTKPISKPHEAEISQDPDSLRLKGLAFNMILSLT